MADHPLVVALLKEYAFEETVTRPEVATIVGKTSGQIAGIHTRNKKKIGTWPTLNPERRKNRRCQYPEGTPGTESFRVCGKPRAVGDPLCCAGHKGMTWTPPEERS